MAIRLNVRLEINLEICDEAAFRADAIEQLARFDDVVDPEFIRAAIADAQAGGWDFVQELVFLTSLLPDLNGVSGADEEVSRPLLVQLEPLEQISVNRKNSWPPANSSWTSASPS